MIFSTVFISFLLFNSVRPDIFGYDLEYAPTNHKQFEQGGGKAYSAAHHSNGGSKGSEGFQVYQQHENGKKGHHDNANLKKHFAEEGGNKKGHHHQDGYYANQNQGSHGSKGYHFQDSGRYAKGHSTKGHHNIHKLDEYKKNTEFFDEDHDEAFKEKYGGFETKKHAEKGGYNQGGHLNKAFKEGNFGNHAKYLKGSHYADDAGYKNAAGNDKFYANNAKYGQSNEGEEFSKHGFSHFIHH